MGKGFSNLNRPPNPFERIIKDEVTGAPMWNTDAVVDHWGRIVHKDWEVKPSPYDFPIPDFTEQTPSFGQLPGETTTQPGQYFVIFRDGVAVGVFYSTDYAPGQYTVATSAQVAAYVPTLNDQTINTTYADLQASPAITTPTFSDPALGGVTWEITSDPSNLFSIDSQTGLLYCYDPEGVADATTYEIVVTLTSNRTNGLTATATITIDVVNEAPTITSSSTVEAPEGQTAVMTVTATDPENNDLTFSLSGGADADRFAIGSSTGVLTFVFEPDYDNPADADADNVYVVEVTVTDTVGNTDSVTISVTVTQVFIPTGSPFLWLSFEDASTVTTDNGALTSISNKVDGATDAFDMETGTFQPAYPDVSVFGGLNTAFFDTDFLRTTRTASDWHFLSDLTGATVFLVFQVGDSSPVTGLFGGGGGTSERVFRIQTQIGSVQSRRDLDIHVNTNSPLINVADAIRENNGYVIAVRTQSSAPNVELWINGVSSGTSSASVSMDNFFTDVRLGRNGVQTSGGMTGYYGTALVYDSALTDTQITDQTTELMSYYGIP